MLDKCEELINKIEAYDGDPSFFDCENIGWLLVDFEDLQVTICGDIIYGYSEYRHSPVSDLIAMIEELKEVVSGKRKPFWKDE